MNWLDKVQGGGWGEWGGEVLKLTLRNPNPRHQLPQW